MFKKVLIANRGAVAARVLRALKSLDIRSVAVYSEADRDLPYIGQADESYCIGPAAPQASYLNQDALLEVLRSSGCDGLHPGYGFLAENAGFATRVIEAGVGFIGPSPRWIEAMGHKTRARELMQAHGLNIGVSSPLLRAATVPEMVQEALAHADTMGYPVIVKPAGGGGGIGMIAAHHAAELPRAIEQAASLSQRNFGTADLYLERLMIQPRHVEFQVLADRHGAVRHLFERDCSVQRRHQKVIEEAPAPLLDRDLVEVQADSITRVLADLRYDVIGTVEMLSDGKRELHFLEMNTRLQVEHAVTEEVTGVDLVVAQIRLAAGEMLKDVLPQKITLRGHAIEARIYAEDPVRFIPSPGRLTRLVLPGGRPGIRVETGYAEGNTVSPYYDPMIAKVIAHADTRDEAIDRLIAALDATEIVGVKNNIPFVRAMLDSEAFRTGKVHTQMASAAKRVEAAAIQ